MIANDAKHIKSARRSGLALMAARWALNFIESETSFTQRPYAAIRAPRSRRDKDMSDNKAIKQTIRIFCGGILHITRRCRPKGDCHLFPEFLPW